MNIKHLRGIKNKFPIKFKNEDGTFKEEFKIEQGQIILWNNFPFYNDVLKKINYRRHYFYIQSIDKENIYLIYMSSKYRKYITDKKINHNYLVSHNLNMNIVFDIKKIVVIDKKWFLKEFEKQQNILIKYISNYKIQNSLKKLIKQSFLFSEEYKKILTSSKETLTTKKFSKNIEFDDKIKIDNIEEYLQNVQQNYKY